MAVARIRIIIDTNRWISEDNFLLALAKDAGADFLITGDKYLLCLEYFEQTQIVSLTRFFSLSFA